MSTNRSHSLDNLRAVMVLCILVLHAVLAYCVSAPWWYAADPDKLPGFDVLPFLLDSFPVPILFFLAGLFAVPSLERYGTVRFLKNKLVRLGLPALVISLTLLPIIAWITLTSRNIPVPGPLEFWTLFAADSLLPKWTLVQTVPDYAAMGISFSQYHLWFITLLLVFFAAYVPLHRLIPAATQDTGKGVMAKLLLGGLIITLITTALASTMHVWSWLNLRWLLVQPVRLPLYFGFFLLGAAAWKRGWLKDGRLPGPFWAWTAAALITTAAYVLITGSLMRSPTLLPPAQSLVLAAIRIGLCLSWLGLLLNGFARWSRGTGGTGPLRSSLAASSYAIYLLHLPVCVVVQWMLIPVVLSSTLKAAMALTLSLALPWILHSAWRRDFRQCKAATR